MQRYNILEKIGFGTFGAVWKAEKEGEIYALKIIDKDYTYPGIENPLEISIALTLNHENIVKTFDAFVDDKDRNILVMEYCESTLLSCYGEYSRAEIYSAFYSLCRGIKYMHDSGFYHGDIKPNNVLINKNTIKVCDFGFSFALNRSRPSINYPTFSSPECYSLHIDKRGKSGIFYQEIKDYRCIDVWSLGVTFAALLTKRMIFETSENSWPYIRKYSEDPEKYLAEYDLTKAEKNLLLRMLKPEISQRISDVCEILHDGLFTGFSTLPIEPFVWKYLPFSIERREKLPILTRWMCEIFDELRYSEEMSHVILTMLYHVYDEITEKESKKSAIQLLGCTCMYLAQKYFSPFMYLPSKFVYLSANSFSEKDLVDMEKRIFTLLCKKMFFSLLYEKTFDQTRDPLEQVCDIALYSKITINSD